MNTPDVQLFTEVLTRVRAGFKKGIPSNCGTVTHAYGWLYCVRVAPYTIKPQLSVSALTFQELLRVIFRAHMWQTDRGSQMPPEAWWKNPETCYYAKLFTYADKLDLGGNCTRQKTQVLHTHRQSGCSCGRGTSGCRLSYGGNKEEAVKLWYQSLVQITLLW